MRIVWGQKQDKTKKRFQITCEDDTLREKWMRERVPRSGWTSQRKRSARGRTSGGEKRFSTQHGPDRHQQFLHTLHSSFVSGRDRRGGRVSRNLTWAYTRSSALWNTATAAAILIRGQCCDQPAVSYTLFQCIPECRFNPGFWLVRRWTRMFYKRSSESSAPHPRSIACDVLHEETFI